ncbi:hypothetical protein HN011_006605 [Eciton burchellii]|nr:hypothetical protein HN011_006605 [Eciton burchellii]
MNNLREGDQVSVFKVITNDDILKFAELTGDYNPIHTESAKNIAHGALLNGLVSGLIGTKLPGAGTIVIEQNLIFPKSCYAGDTVEVVVKIISAKMYIVLMIMSLCISYSYTEKNNTILNIVKSPTNLNEQSVGCVCAVFLNGQFKKGSREQPKGYPALLHEYPNPLPCSAIGNKLCTSKCLDVIVKYLPNSQTMLCASIERDCHKERAYLFIKNCKDEWINTNLSAGREYCCKNGLPYNC